MSKILLFCICSLNRGMLKCLDLNRPVWCSVLFVFIILTLCVDTNI